MSESELDATEQAALDQLGEAKVRYSSADLSRYRELTRRYPPQIAHRFQLFLNFKGGTGKTSLSVSYAHRIAEMGHRVLIVDLDSQAHATKCLGYDGEALDETLYDVLVHKRPIHEVKIETPLTQLHLLPSSLRMATIDLQLMPMSSRELRLKKALAEINGDYDLIVMDAPPAFGLMNLNAIVSAQDLFVPVLPDFLSFHGLKLLFETIDDVAEDLDHELDRIFVVINQFNPTTTIARSAREALESHFSEYLLPSVIRQCTKFAQASSEGVPIFLFDPSSKGAQDIQRIIDATLLPRGGEG
ncbi:MAG: ParA family protein [Myxococcales bacterium]|nr:ParA family protein [Myxococcales bacterium]